MPKEPDQRIDADLNDYLDAAVNLFESLTNIQILKSVDDFITDCFPPGGEPVYIPRWPLHSDGVTSLKYNDSDGTEQTWSSANYNVSSHTAPITCPPIAMGTEVSWRHSRRTR